MSVFFVRDVFDPQALADLRAAVESREFVDGKSTASGNARKVKHNLQLELMASADLARVVTQALLGNARFRSLTFTRKIRQPQFARYLVGMAYGAHLDAPIFTGENPIRADLSVTLFLSDDYEGGELIIYTSTGEERVKLPAGHAVIYPADTLHSVAPVTSGERLVAVTWIQSHVRDPQMRLILSELGEVVTYLRALPESPENTQALFLASKSRDNLMRKIAEF